MIRSVVSIALALLITACPLTCRMIALCSHGGDEISEASVATACQFCCEKDQRSDADEHESVPPPTCPCQSNCRDCICCGAIVQEGVDYEPVLLPSLDALVEFTSAVSAANHTSLELVPTDGPPAALSGRDVRTRISSFLC